jgi:hypothetical protein
MPSAGGTGDELATGLLLAAALADTFSASCRPIGLALLQTPHELRREGSPGAFPVQVRIGYLAGSLADFCPVARMVALLP